jgi:hypothetical protein
MQKGGGQPDTQRLLSCGKDAACRQCACQQASTNQESSSVGFQRLYHLLLPDRNPSKLIKVKYVTNQERFYLIQRNIA